MVGIDDLQINNVAGLIDSLNAKQDKIEENGLPQSKVTGLRIFEWKTKCNTVLED